ncbi:unnamed protein product [Discosporangium mesarthrocarpum]
MSATAHNTLHQFCFAFVKDMVDKWIFVPEGEELQNMMSAYERLRFPGAEGCSVVTHVRWDMAPYIRGSTL